MKKKLSNAARPEGVKNRGLSALCFLLMFSETVGNKLIYATIMQLTTRRVKSPITSLLSVALSQALKLVTRIKIRTDGGAKINIRNRTRKIYEITIELGNMEHKKLCVKRD